MRIAALAVTVLLAATSATAQTAKPADSNWPAKDSVYVAHNFQIGRAHV